MSPGVMVIAAILVAGILYVLFKLTSGTAREMVIPLASGDPSPNEVKAALETMGCLVAEGDAPAVRGFIPGDGFNWGQQVTVRLDEGQLRVTSSFSGSQAYGASKNEENLERFKAEWERRSQFRGAADDPTYRAQSEARAREVARKSLRGGGAFVLAGIGLLTLALVPREGDHASADVRLVGFALVCFAYGVPRAWAAFARLRNKPGPR